MARKNRIVFAVMAAMTLITCKGGVQPAGEPAGGGGPAPGTTAVAQGPVIACDQPTWEFGAVAEGEVVRHTFAIRNTGGAPLKIESARGSCGCTATVVSSNEVPPGGEARIDVAVNTQGRRGALDKTVVVASNDPKTPRLTLKVAGQVEVIAGFSPHYLNLGRMLKGSKRTEVVPIVAKEPGKVRIGEVTANDPRVTARLVEGRAGEPAVEVTIEAGDQEGPLGAMVTAKTNLDSPKEIVLRLNGIVSGDIGVEPPRVFFRDFAEDKPQGLDLRVSALSGKPFRVLGVEDAQRAVRGDAKQDGASWIVALSLVRKPDAENGTIRVRTDRKDQPVLEVPYRVGGRPGGFRAGGSPMRRAVPTPDRAGGRAAPVAPATTR